MCPHLTNGRLCKALEVSANDVLILNYTQRKPGMGTSGAYPKWWETFVLLGTEGDGGYFCLRLDGVPGVWIIGSDDGGEPEKRFDSLAEFVDHCIALVRS